jgi:hypothetical protein
MIVSFALPSPTALRPMRQTDDLLAAVEAVSKKRRLEPTGQKLDELLELLEGWRARPDNAHGPELVALREKLSKHDAHNTGSV